MKLRLALALPLLALFAGCASDETSAGNVPSVDPGPVTASYGGRVLYRGTNAAVADVTVQVAGARDDGSLTDDVYGTARTDARGRFTVTSTAQPGQKVALVAAAVEETAETGGDRRAEGYEIKKRETSLGSLVSPNPAGPNTLLVEPRRLGRGEDERDAH